MGSSHGGCSGCSGGATCSCSGSSGSSSCSCSGCSGECTSSCSRNCSRNCKTSCNGICDNACSSDSAVSGIANLTVTLKDGIMYAADMSKLRNYLQNELTRRSRTETLTTVNRQSVILRDVDYEFFKYINLLCGTSYTGNSKNTVTKISSYNAAIGNLQTLMNTAVKQGRK